MGVVWGGDVVNMGVVWGGVGGDMGVVWGRGCFKYGGCVGSACS